MPQTLVIDSLTTLYIWLFMHYHLYGRSMMNPIDFNRMLYGHYVMLCCSAGISRQTINQKRYHEKFINIFEDYLKTEGKFNEFYNIIIQTDSNPDSMQYSTKIYSFISDFNIAYGTRFD